MRLNHSTESKLDCFEISLVNAINLSLFNLASESLAKGKKQPHSSPKYHKKQSLGHILTLFSSETAWARSVHFESLLAPMFSIFLLRMVL